MHYPLLFSKLRLGPVELRSRIVLSPMTTGFGFAEGVPDETFTAYIRARSRAVGMVVVAFGAVAPEGRVEEQLPWMWREDIAGHLRPLVTAVHAEGALACLQLGHGGRQVSPVVTGLTPVAPSPVPPPVHVKEPPHELSAAEIEEIVDAFGRAAARAADAGFDAVELHGAHGYLLDEFLWTRTNLRTDSYGGSLAARTRFPAEVVAAVRGAVGPDYPIVYRFSQWKASDFGASIVGNPVELQELLGPLVDAGVDLFHPSTRRHYAPAFPDADPALSLSGWTKKVTGVPVIAVGSVGLETQFRSERPGDVIQPAAVDRLVDQFEAGEFDLAAIGRALLADPTWVNRLRDDTLDGFNGYDAAVALAGLS